MQEKLEGKKEDSEDEDEEGIQTSTGAIEICTPQISYLDFSISCSFLGLGRGLVVKLLRGISQHMVD